MSLVASPTLGRIRLSDAGFREQHRLKHLVKTIRRWRHIHTVTANQRTGSLTIHYDADALDAARLTARLNTAAAKILALPPQENSTPPRKLVAPGGTGDPSRVKVNRWAKRGMLASLVVSLLLAGAGRKRWHALSGGLFVASLAVHLWIHRRHILR